MKQKENEPKMTTQILRTKMNTYRNPIEQFG